MLLNFDKLFILVDLISLKGYVLLSIIAYLIGKLL